MKLSQLQQHLKQQKIDLALFIHPDITITYFTQFLPSYAYLAITPATATLHLTKLDSFPKIPLIAVKNLSASWTKDLKKRRIKKIGINKKSVTVSQLEKIKKSFPHALFVDLSNVLDELRSQKTPQEITKIAKACEITSVAFSQLVKELPAKKLRTEKDVALYIDQQFRHHGAEPSFPTIVAMSKNAAIPHHVPNDTPLGKGFLVIDFGAKYQHYCADMTRTLYLGKPTAQERADYELVWRAQQAGVDAIKEGQSFIALDKAARVQLKKKSSYFIHSLGHGIGLEVHEAPSFFEKDKCIAKNHVFTIEPGLYFPSKYGIRIEDTLVFDGKVTILTSYPKGLRVIPGF